MKREGHPALIAAGLFVLLSIGVAVASFSGAFSPAPPALPTITPNPTQPRPTVPPTATDAPTLTALPASDARLIIELVSTTDQIITAAFMQALTEALDTSPLTNEAGIRTVEQPTGEAALLITLDPTEGERVAIIYSAAPSAPLPTRIDQRPMPWFLITPDDIPYIMPTPEDVMLPAALGIVFLELSDNQIEAATSRLMSTRQQALNRVGELPASVFAILDFTQGYINSLNGEPRRALQDYSQAIRAAEGASQATLNRANVYLISGDAETALTTYQSIDVSPQSEVVRLYNQALAALALDDLSQAEALAQTLPAADYTAQLQGVIAYRQGNYTAALEAFNRVQASQQIANTLNIARTHQALSNYDQALAAYATLIEQAPDEAQFYIYQGQAYRQAGQPENAAAAFERAALLDETDPTPYIQRAELALADEAWEDAITLAQAALERDPQAGQAYFLIGEAHLAQENWREARTAYNEAEDRGERSIPLYAHRGWAYHNLRSLFSAVADYSIAIDLGADDTQLLYRLGFALYNTGQYEDALEAITGAINGGFDSPNAYALLAVALDANFRRDEAERIYATLIERDERYADPAFLREQTLWSEAGISRARTIINRLESP